MIQHPVIIQGGMGVAVSGWQLARAVAQEGQLGVASGTLLGVVLARRLQLGDREGTLRRALAAFPFPEVARRVRERWFNPDGKPEGTPFRGLEMPSLEPSREWVELTVLGNFIEVWLAKEGHGGRVGINLLEKIQLPTLPSLYGAMLAGVDYVLMGAGIPRTIPGCLDQLSRGEAAELCITLVDAPAGQARSVRFAPADFCGGPPPVLRRPWFLAVVSSSTLAQTLARKSTGRVDGFVVENEAAGGHNAPPRGGLTLSAKGEPVYGPRDVPDLAKFRELGLPFWLAGAQAEPAALAAAQTQGAWGVQIGTAFAFCAESGITTVLKEAVRQASRLDQARVLTDPVASPTRFPFKLVQLPGTVAEERVYATRSRVCDLGYLRENFLKPDGTVGFRCGGEPVEHYLRKGGEPTATEGRKCLCNGLLATVGLGQVRAGRVEPPLVTAGTEVARLHRFEPAATAATGGGSQQGGEAGLVDYSAAAVIQRVLGAVPNKKSLLPSDDVARTAGSTQ